MTTHWIQTYQDYLLELDEIREKYDMPTDEVELCYQILQDNPMGVEMHMLGLHLGLHWTDYAGVWTILRAMNKKYGDKGRVTHYRPAAHTSVVRLKSSEYRGYMDEVSTLYKHARKKGLSIGTPYVRDPEDANKKAERRKVEARKKDIRERQAYASKMQDLIESCKKLPNGRFTIPQLESDWDNTEGFCFHTNTYTGQGLRNKLRELCDYELVEVISLGGKGRGNSTVYRKLKNATTQ